MTNPNNAMIHFVIKLPCDSLTNCGCRGFPQPPIHDREEFGGIRGGADLGRETIGKRIARSSDAPAGSRLRFEQCHLTSRFHQDVRGGEAGESAADDHDTWHIATGHLVLDSIQVHLTA